MTRPSDHDRLVLVAALPDTWRACASTVNDPTSPSIFVECAEELERVLNDDDAEAYRAEVDKLRGDEQDAWVRLGAELCEAETERDKLRAEVDQLRALKMLVLAYKRDCDSENVDPYDARCELFDALD